MDSRVVTGGFPRRRRVVVGIMVLALLLVGLVTTAAANDYTPSGTIVSDSGFRPATNGYSFENYTNDSNPENLNAESMRKLFGPGVCMSGGGESGGCTLTPPARTWKETQNKSMAGGHCEGFAVTASLFYAGLGEPSDPSPFGAGTVPALSLTGNAPLQNHIAYGYVFQALPSISTAKVNGSPSEVLDALIAALPSKEPMVLGVYKRGFVGGHAITPLAVEDRGGGMFAVLVYDNNYPNVIREVDIDRNANTWNYKASTNPGEQADLYEGDATTKTLEIEYARNGLGTQPCPFCGGAGDSPRKPARLARDDGGSGQAQLFLQGDARDGQHSDVTIVDGDGNTTGCTGTGDDRECTSDIPGVELVPTKLEEGGVDVWNESAPPMFDLPSDLPFEVDFDAGALDGPANEGFSLVRDGVTFTLEDLHLGEGDEQQVNVGEKDIAMSNGADHQINPTIGYDDLAAGDGYEVTVRATGVDPDSELDLTARPGRKSLQLDFDGSRREDVRVITTVTRTRDDGKVDKARSRPTTIDGGDGGRLSYGDKAFRDGKLELDL
jgi:hypothetical protein